MKNEIFTFSFILLLVLIFMPVSSSRADNKNPPPTKCEKCYRGPDGKMKCETVPCPK